MSDRIDQNIEEMNFAGKFLDALISQAQNPEQNSNMDFLDILTSTAKALRNSLQRSNLIGEVSLPANEFWKSQRGKTLSFIDGGVSSVNLRVSHLVGIRAGSYTVNLGESLESKEREHFDIVGCMVDDLFNSELHDGDFEDTSTLTDATRMLVEVLAAETIASSQHHPDATFLHGPLINPIAPYGRQGTSTTPGFPFYSQKGRDELRQISKLLDFPIDKDGLEFGHFMRAYSETLQRMAKSGKLIVGVVERPAKKSKTVSLPLLEFLARSNCITSNDSAKLKRNIEFLAKHGMGDAAIFSIVLAPGEYLLPFVVNRQGYQGDWPKNWEKEIRQIPNPAVAFLRPSPDSEVVRLECFENATYENKNYLCELTTYMSQLLPKYCFPVGLDIVDKDAKVPNWLTKGIESQYGVAMLREALSTNNIENIHYAKRILLANGRDWLFRPKARV
jgi:hypothetical protein